MDRLPTPNQNPALRIYVCMLLCQSPRMRWWNWDRRRFNPHAGESRRSQWRANSRVHERAQYLMTYTGSKEAASANTTQSSLGRHISIPGDSR